MSDYGEIFCEAVEEIVRNELRGLDFDLTRVCQIDNVDERDKGIYIVSTDSARFKAYSSDTTYNVGDTVYVVTPNNDNTQQKIIIAKKVIETPQDITYVMPFNNITDITKNLVNGSRENSLLANGLIGNSDTKNAQPIWEYNNLLVGYTRLGVQGSFRSSIADAIEGSYGLKVELYTKGRNEESRLIATFFLDSDDMYGNPYNFDGYYIQQKVFDISSIPAFDAIKVYFYQDSDFKNSQGELVAHLDSFGRNLNPNLFINDLYICLGYDADDVYNNGLILYSRDGYLYDANGGERRIEWRFLYTGKDKKTTLITEPEKLPYGYSIRLYKYNTDTMYNSIAGANWEEVLDEKGNSLGDFTIYTFQTIGTKESDKFKVVIIYNNRVLYESNILQFTNTADLIYVKLDKLQDSFQIRTSGDYNGIYHVYDDNNNIITAKSTQYLYPMFQDDDGIYTTIPGIEKIKWTIPKNNTMINLAISPEKIYKIEDESLGEDKSENAITQYIETLDPLEFNYYTYGDYYYAYFIKPENNEIPFKLKEVLNANNNNNTIICNLEHANLKLKSTKELIFGYKSIEDYRAELSFEDSSIDGFLLSDSKNNIKRNVILKFYDPAGAEVPSSDYTVKISWHRADDNGPDDGKPIDTLFDYSSQGNNTYSIYFISEFTTMPNENYNVFRADITYKDYIYTALLPISISANENIEIEGVTNIVYNENGKPQNNTQEIIAKYKKSLEELEDMTLDFISSYDTEDAPDKFKPNFDTDTKQLQPLATSIENLKAIYAFVAKDKDGSVIKIQPVVPIVETLVQRVKDKPVQVGNPLSRDNTPTYQIQSANFSAGKLEDEQQYTGVVMGKVQKNGEQNGKYGLYGFKSDEMTFSIDQDGKAYFKGTVEAEGGTFNGELNATTGKIGGWEITEEGLIDSSGEIELKPGKDGDTPGIWIGGFFFSEETLIGDSLTIDGVNVGPAIAELRGTDTQVNNALSTLDDELQNVEDLLKVGTSTPAKWENITFISSISLAEDKKTINYQTTTMPILTYGNRSTNSGSFTIEQSQ